MEFVAIVLIGGAGTVAGTLMGTAFVILSPRVVEDHHSTGSQPRPRKAVPSRGSVQLIIRVDHPTTGSGSSRLEAAGPGLSIFQFNAMLFGVLIIVFLIAEPLGLYGIWIRIRNYWKGWPFTY